MANDPRTSDEATGLPPLEQVDPDDTILVTTWTASEGVATSPITGSVVAVRYLSVRGLARLRPGDPTPQWAQFHIAVPAEHAVDVAAALAKGTTEQLDADG